MDMDNSLDITVHTSNCISFESFGNTTQIACDTYTAPSGMVYTSSGVYSDTIPNAEDCDSIISIDLTINTTPSVSLTAVDSLCSYHS